MKKLQNYFKLGSKVTVYVPNTLGPTDEIKGENAYIDKTAKALSEYFGGATSTAGIGYWVSNEHGLIKERSTMVFAYCTTEQLEEHIDDIVTLCENLKTDMQQEAIALEINGEMYFI